MGILRAGLCYAWECFASVYLYKQLRPMLNKFVLYIRYF